MNRESTVERLSEDMAATLRDDPNFRWSVARNGWRGFATMTNEELRRVYNEAFDEEPPK